LLLLTLLFLFLFSSSSSFPCSCGGCCAGLLVAACGALVILSNKNGDSSRPVPSSQRMPTVRAPGPACAQHTCVRALTTHSARTAQNQAKIAAAGGIERIIAAMDHHKAHSGLHVQACGVLRNLAATPGTQNRIAACGYVALLGARPVHSCMRASRGARRCLRGVAWRVGRVRLVLVACACVRLVLVACVWPRLNAPPPIASSSS